MSPAVFPWNFPLIDEADETDDNDSDASSVNSDGDLLPDLIDTKDIPQDDPLMEELLIWEEKMKAVMVHLDKFVKSFEENMKNSNKMMDALEIDGKDSKESANSEADDEDDENLALYSENYSLIPGEILALDEAANGDDYAPY